METIEALDERVKVLAAHLRALLPKDYLDFMDRRRGKMTIGEMLADTAMYYPQVYVFMLYVVEAHDLDKISHLLWEVISEE
jgi:hypothetical protein